MKHGHAWAIGLLGLALSACGGSGGSDRRTSTDTSNLGLTADYRVEAIVSDQSLDPGYVYQDPLSIQAGDGVTFQLVSYSGSGGSVSRNVVATQASSPSGVSFVTNDSNGLGGALSPTDGIFRAANTDSGSQQFILTARYQGNSYNVLYRINPRLNQARVRGRVVDSSGNGVYNARVDFYEPRNTLDTDSRQVVVATVRTAVDGTFRASVPVPSTTNTLDSSTADDATPPAITYSVRPPDGYGQTFSAPTIDALNQKTIGTFTVGAPFNQDGTTSQPTLAFLVGSLVNADSPENPLLPSLRQGDFYLDQQLGGTIVISDEGGETPTPLGAKKK